VVLVLEVFGESLPHRPPGRCRRGGAVEQAAVEQLEQALLEAPDKAHSGGTAARRAARRTRQPGERPPSPRTGAEMFVSAASNLQTFHASCLIRHSSSAAQPQMSCITLSTTREPKPASLIGSSRMCTPGYGARRLAAPSDRSPAGSRRLRRRSAWRPSLRRRAPRPTASSIWLVCHPDASFRLASQLSRSAGPMASTSPLRNRSTAKPARSRAGPAAAWWQRCWRSARPGWYSRSG